MRDADATTTLEESLVDAVVTARFDASSLAVARAKSGILDAVGVALAGSMEPVARAARELAAGPQDAHRAQVWGTPMQSTTLDAAYANAVAAHALDWDDYSHPLYGHCSAILAPICLALAEATRASGRQVIEAYLAGHEVDSRLGAAATLGHYRKGWHATSTIGVVGAAACAAKLMELSAAETLAALGIAASHAGGVRENFGSMTKPLHAGQAARNGAMAALLAKRGVTASATALTGRFGFLRLYGDSPGHHVATRSSDGLAIEGEWGLVLKPYACCGSSHALIDAMLALVREGGVEAGDVVSVVCRVDPVVNAILTHHQPTTAMEARYSLEYPMAIALLERAAAASQFVDAKVAAPEAQALMRKVRIVDDLHNPEDSVFAGEVRLRLTDGRELVKRVEHALGHPLNPMSDAQRMEKFTTAASSVLAQGRVARLAALLDGLEHVADMGEVGAALARPGSVQ